jgi:diguanylate cyclase (GGDEF)-like protein
VLQRRDRPFCVAMIDLDHFKRVNDTYGHSVGDMALRSVGRLLRTQTRKEDVVGRFGGEEFQLLMPDLTLDEAVQCAERIREAMRDLRFDVEGLAVTASFGVVQATEGDTAETLERRSDEAMYRAKKEGRDRVVAVRLDS